MLAYAIGFFFLSWCVASHPLLRHSAFFSLVYWKQKEGSPVATTPHLLHTYTLDTPLSYKNNLCASLLQCTHRFCVSPSYILWPRALLNNTKEEERGRQSMTSPMQLLEVYAQKDDPITMDVNIVKDNVGAQVQSTDGNTVQLMYTPNDTNAGIKSICFKVNVHSHNSSVVRLHTPFDVGVGHTVKLDLNIHVKGAHGTIKKVNVNPNAPKEFCIAFDANNRLPDNMEMNASVTDSSGVQFAFNKEFFMEHVLPRVAQSAASTGGAFDQTLSASGSGGGRRGTAAAGSATSDDESEFTVYESDASDDGEPTREAQQMGAGGTSAIMTLSSEASNEIVRVLQIYGQAILNPNEENKKKVREVLDG